MWSLCETGIDEADTCCTWCLVDVVEKRGGPSLDSLLNCGYLRSFSVGLEPDCGGHITYVP